jgi:predicted amidohydrolase YtcJ
VLLVTADRIHTFDDRAPLVEALLLRRGRIVASGRRADLRAAAPNAAILDLPGTTITPGLVDAHIHLLEWALARRQPDLATADSPAAAAAIVAAHAPPSGEAWVQGRGWNPHRWDGEAPDRRALDGALPDRPVALRSHDMHALWVNSAALAAAGIDRATPDPPGGRIVRDADGAATGLLLENAIQLVTARIPDPDDDLLSDAVLAGQAELHSLGITGVHCAEMAVGAFHTLRILEHLRSRDLLRLRVLQHLPLPRLDDAIRLGLRSGFGGEWIRIGAVKLFLDGALGSRTAWLREPYEGTTDTGMRVMEPAAFRAAVGRAAAAGLAAMVHAIGDAAVDLALDVLSHPDLAVPAMPHRIEHVQLCPGERLADAARAGIVCSMQPAHLMTDWRPADRHWGGRARHAYAFRSLVEAGATLAFGSDAPVEPVDPRLGLYAAATRTDLAGEPAAGWYPAERIGIASALRAYTVGAAVAAGDARRGTLGVGADADLVAWDRDPLTAQGEEILRLRCHATLVAGRVAWSDAALAPNPTS